MAKCRYNYKAQESHILFDDAVNITSELHDPSARKSHLRNKKKKDLKKSTGVVSAEYPSKVKLKLFSQL